MSKTPKFRVFDGKKIINDIDLNFTCDGDWCAMDGYMPITSSYSDGILMQYAELKDSINTEIYSGDIIELDMEIIEDVKFYINIRYSVEVSTIYGVCFKCQSLTNIHGLHIGVDKGVISFSNTAKDGRAFITRRINIIGNIYENPELIKNGE